MRRGSWNGRTKGYRLHWRLPALIGSLAPIWKGFAWLRRAASVRFATADCRRRWKRSCRNCLAKCRRIPMTGSPFGICENGPWCIPWGKISKTPWGQHRFLRSRCLFPIASSLRANRTGRSFRPPGRRCSWGRPAQTILSFLSGPGWSRLTVSGCIRKRL